MTFLTVKLEIVTLHTFRYPSTPSQRKDNCSIHTCPPYTLSVSGDFYIRSPEWKFLYTLCIRMRVDARIRIFLYTLTSQYQNQSFSAAILHRPSKQMSCLWFFSVFLLIETFFMVFFNRNCFRSSSSHVLKPEVNKQESREFGAKIIAGSPFFVMRMLC